ncbi:DMT family transporter [Bordetella genomosp. 13]|uniref:EamA family transporter n=1 Tax=Bordetella genomosp. 13 TaxID=463040 RepID=A0A1W6ZFM0_9BORD|nr:DMT family transporter [Bordetella genomosp. 13]ARP95644.1 EamA family transporter [Bordetella genomosp. 13]
MPSWSASARHTGIACFLLALSANALFDAGAKHLLASYPAPFLNVMRYGTVTALGVFLVLREGKWPAWSMLRAQPLLLARGLALAVVGTCFMTALIWMPLSEATAIYFTAPLIMVALSPWLLGERVSCAQWISVAIGLGGMLFIVRPGGSLPPLGTVLMVISAVCYALFQLLTRKLAGKVDATVQYVCTALICLAATLPPALLFPPQQWPPLLDWCLILGLGALNGAAQMLMLAAFRHVDAATLAPLNYLQLLMAVLLSATIFQRPPDILAMAGMAMIAAAGIMLVRRPRYTGAAGFKQPSAEDST